MRRTLLSISTDRRLWATRAAVLAHAGYAVTPANSAARALEILKARDFDGVVIGHTLARDEARSIIRYLRRKPRRPCVVLMHRLPEDAHGLEADVRVGSLDGPQALLKALSKCWEEAGP